MAGKPSLSFTSSLTPDWVYFLKPDISTVKVYVPGKTGVNTNVPSGLVATSRGTPPCASLASTTLAVGMTAPCASRTVPLIAPPVWATTIEVPASRIAAAARNNSRIDMYRLLFCPTRHVSLSHGADDGLPADTVCPKE